MSFLSDKVAIEQYLVANPLTTNVVYENMEPDLGWSEWARVTIQGGNGHIASLGNNPIYRYPGVIIFQIFTKLGIGSGRAVTIADEIDALLKSRRLGSVVFQVPNIQKIGPNNNWYQINVLVDFYSEV